jgi:hypothetical protein
MVLRTATKDEKCSARVHRSWKLVAIQAELRWEQRCGRCEVPDNAPSGGWVEIKLARKRIPSQWPVDALSALSANRNLRPR